MATFFFFFFFFCNFFTDLFLDFSSFHFVRHTKLSPAALFSIFCYLPNKMAVVFFFFFFFAFLEKHGG